MMGIANEHNLVDPIGAQPRPYGIAIRLKPGDPFSKLLGEDWRRVHWYASATGRDRALADMASEHEYSRVGDTPALLFEKVENLVESRGI
ncbi:MAG TPA: hypothetical protein VMU86_02345 [Steroidobacteraceae bacterium]|nr:hypothetical protein [Steroidobacteraceae bacterium]